MPLYIAQSGDLDRCYRCLTDWLTTLKDRATQLLIKYKSGALVTQSVKNPFSGRLSGGRGGGEITRRIRRTHARQRAACNLMKYLSSCVIIISDWTQAINYFANWCHSFREADPVHRIQCSCTFFTPSLWCLVSPWRFVSTSIFILPHLLKERLNSNNKTLTFS